MIEKPVPFLDLRAGYLALKPGIDVAVARVMDSGWYILGPEVEAFETAFSKFCKAEHCVGVANGLDALILSLRALDVGPGDEVIVPSNTFIATWLAVSAVGAVPVPVEPDPLTYNIDPALVPSAITSKTRAIIAVHLYGQPADLDPLIATAHEHGLVVIEDAAQAHGAEYKKSRIGAGGDVVCWSFYPGKNLGALGDGGAITTNRADVAMRVKTLRNYGSNQKYVNVEQGTNSRLDPIQAAVLSVKLDHLADWTLKRQAIAKNYFDNLRGVTLPFVPDWADPVWHLFVIRHDKRDELMSSLAEEGISTMVHYPIPPHLQDAYKIACYEKGSFPLAEKFAADMLSLPIGPQMSDDDQNRVIETVNRLAGKL